MNDKYIFPKNATLHDYRGWAHQFRQTKDDSVGIEFCPDKVSPGELTALEIKISLSKSCLRNYSNIVMVLPFPGLRSAASTTEETVIVPDNLSTRFSWPILEILLPESWKHSSLDIKIPRFPAPQRPGTCEIEVFIGNKHKNFKKIDSERQLVVSNGPAENLGIYASNNFYQDKIRFSVVAEQAESSHFVPERNCSRSFLLECYGKKEKHKFSPSDRGIKKITLPLPKGRNASAVKAFWVGDRRSSESNWIIPEFMRDDDNNIYFGDIHAHSHESDGNGEAEEMMRYARDWKRLDFFALNEHIEQRLSWTTWNAEKWERIRKINEDFNQDNEFITIPGFEYRSYCNLWCFDDEYLKYSNPAFHGDKEHPVALPTGTTEAKILQEAIQEQIEEFTKKKNWLVGYHRLETMLATFGKVPVPVHLLQLAHGKRPPETGSEIFLERGDKVGFFGATDTHVGIPGQVFSGPHDGQSGLTAVIAPKLSRLSLHSALRKRHCYATMGSRTLVKFILNGYMMGETIKIPEDMPVTIELKAAGREIIEKIELVRDGKTVFCKDIDKNEAKITWTGACGIEKHEYFFARIHLKDKRKIWTSPVYVSPA